MGYLQKINAVWQKIGIVQRALLLAIIVACAITAGLLTKWASKADMQLLYSKLTPDQAGKIVDKISEADIPYDLRGGGTSIYVPSDKVHQLRLTMAKDGLPGGGQTGYGLFDNEKIGISPLVQQTNLKRAMQDEMAKTIQMLDGVDFARVHLVLPEDSIYGAEDKSGSASVVLQVKPGWRLNATSIAAITNIVAGATDGLKPENVTVVDSQGRLLTNNAADKGGTIASAGNFMDYKDRVEQTIAGKVQDMLETVLGPGRSTVQVSAELDMDGTETMSTTYTKGESAQETIKTKTTTQGGTVDPDGNEISGTNDKDETIDTVYKVPETVTKTIEIPGQIISLAVSAAVDLSPPAPQTNPDQQEGQEQTTAPAATEPIMTIDQVKAMIRNAVGPELLKGQDALTVEDVRFYKPVMTAVEDAASYEKLSRYIEIARQSSMGILAVCALIVLKIFTGAKKKAVKQEAGDNAATRQLDAMNVGLLPSGAGDETGMALRRHIAGALKENPEQVKQLFASWLEER